MGRGGTAWEGGEREGAARKKAGTRRRGGEERGPPAQEPKQGQGPRGPDVRCAPAAPRRLAVPPSAPGAGEDRGLSGSPGLSGRFCWSFVAALSETGEPGCPAAGRVGGAAPARGEPPLRAPHSVPSQLSPPRPLRLTFPHLWASLRPPWVPSPFQVARPASPLPPGRDSPTRGENKQPPRALKGSVRLPDGRLGGMKQAADHHAVGPGRIMGARQIAGGT